MSDVISREDAIQAVIAQRHKAELSEHNFALRLAEDAIRHLPSARQKIGRWRMKGLDVVCSECGREALFMRVRKVGKGEIGRGVLCETDYCPWCGTKMEVEE